MYKIACIMGKSSSGKDHIYRALLEKDNLQLKNVVMYTTRPKRSGETEGVEYHFVTEDKLNDMERAGKIIELRQYNTVHGLWSYFTADDGQIDLNEGMYIVIGTLEAYEKFCEYYGKDIVMPIYIEVDDGIRLERALLRERKQENPKYREMCRRFLADCEDFSEEKLADAGITKKFMNNGSIEDCIEEVSNAIKNSR